MERRELIRKLKTTPYVEHGRNFRGIDCYGLLLLYYKYIKGIILPDYFYDSDWYNQRKDFFIEEYPKLWKKVDKPQIDFALLFYGINRMVTHVGIYIGKGKFIQALRKVGVVELKLTKWKPRLYGIFEYVGNSKI